MKQLTERYKIARLIARKVAGTLTGEEADFLEKWTEESGKHRVEMARVENRLKEDLQRGRELNPEEEWKAFQRRLPRKNTVRWWWSAAAMVAGVCVVAGVLLSRDAENSRAVSTIRGK